jgi:ATP-dependent helicase/nuclease subunit A
MHRLLQALPDIPATARWEAGKRYLMRRAKQFTADECESMMKQVYGVIEDPRFSALFAPSSRAEVPIVGRFLHGGRTLAVAGEVDRLAVTGDAILLGDFKTNRPAARQLDDVPPAYICQLALYRGALLQLYPRKTLRAALIWTEIPDLMEIPAAAMERALGTLTSP